MAPTGNRIFQCLRGMARMRQGRGGDATRIENRINKLPTKARFNLSQVATYVFGETGALLVNELPKDAPSETIL